MPPEPHAVQIFSLMLPRSASDFQQCLHLGLVLLTGATQSQLCTTFCSQECVFLGLKGFSLIVSDHFFNISRTQGILILSSKVPATSEWVAFQLSGYRDFEISHVFKILNKDLDLEMCIYPFTYFP